MKIVSVLFNIEGTEGRYLPYEDHESDADALRRVLPFVEGRDIVSIRFYKCCESTGVWV